MMSISASIKSFFDTAAVEAKLPIAARQALSKIGAYVRRVMQNRVGKDGKGQSAPPGQSPFKHAGQLHDLIFFAYDETSRTVVIGPAAFKDATAPRVLEFGGEETITTRGPRRKDGTREIKQRQAHYKGNPFAAPSLAASIEAGIVPASWADSIHA